MLASNFHQTSSNWKVTIFIHRLQISTKRQIILINCFFFLYHTRTCVRWKSRVSHRSNLKADDDYSTLKFQRIVLEILLNLIKSCRRMKREIWLVVKRRIDRWFLKNRQNRSLDIDERARREMEMKRHLWYIYTSLWPSVALLFFIHPQINKQKLPVLYLKNLFSLTT